MATLGVRCVVVPAAELNPSHDFLFTMKNGKPLDDKSLYKLFWTAAYRITGKKTNPHLVRDSIVTFLRSAHHRCIDTSNQSTGSAPQELDEPSMPPDGNS
jgi:hypothetical protein